MWLVTFQWKSTAPRYPNLGSMEWNGYFLLQVTLEPCKVVLASVNSRLVWHERPMYCFEEKRYSEEEWVIAREELKQRLLQEALVLARKNLKLLKEEPVTNELRFVESLD